MAEKRATKIDNMLFIHTRTHTSLNHYLFVVVSSILRLELFKRTFFTPRYEYTYSSFPKLKHILSLKFCCSCCCCCDTDIESEIPFVKDDPATLVDDVIDDWCGMYLTLFDVTCKANRMPKNHDNLSSSNGKTENWIVYLISGQVWRKKMGDLNRSLFATTPHPSFFFSINTRTGFVAVVLVEMGADTVEPALNVDFTASDVFGLAGSSDTRTCGLFWFDW